MNVLSGSELRELRARGQTLKASVHVGKQGFSSSVRAELEQSLFLNDLVKISIPDKGAARKKVAADIALKMNAQCVGVVGSSALIYRPRPANSTN